MSVPLSIFCPHPTPPPHPTPAYFFQKVFKVLIYYLPEDFVRKLEEPPQRAHHVESMSIRRRYYIDTLKTKFWWISDSFPPTFLV